MLLSKLLLSIFNDRIVKFNELTNGLKSVENRPKILNYMIKILYRFQFPEKFRANFFRAIVPSNCIFRNIVEGRCKQTVAFEVYQSD